MARKSYHRELFSLIILALVAGTVLAAEAVRQYTAPRPQVTEMTSNVGSPVGQIAPGIQVQNGALVPSMATAKQVAQPLAQQYTQQLADMVKNPMKIQPFDRVLGSPKAPITIVEFASLTCSHCADFHAQTFPQLKRDWIDTGKAKFVLRDLAWDNLALGMAKVARCAPSFSYYGLVDAMFNDQQAIMTSADPLLEINKIARMAGMTDDQVKSCIQNSDLHVLITGLKDAAISKLGITGTPTLLIGQPHLRVNGAEGYEKVKQVLLQAQALQNADQGKMGTPVQHAK